MAVAGIKAVVTLYIPVTSGSTPSDSFTVSSSNRGPFYVRSGRDVPSWIAGAGAISVMRSASRAEKYVDTDRTNLLYSKFYIKSSAPSGPYQFGILPCTKVTNIASSDVALVFNNEIVEYDRLGTAYTTKLLSRKNSSATLSLVDVTSKNSANVRTDALTYTKLKDAFTSGSEIGIGVNFSSGTRDDVRMIGVIESIEETASGGSHVISSISLQGVNAVFTKDNVEFEVSYGAD